MRSLWRIPNVEKRPSAAICLSKIKDTSLKPDTLGHSLVTKSLCVHIFITRNVM